MFAQPLRRLWTPEVELVLTLGGVAAGLVFGGLVGHRIGERVRGRRRAYWALNVAVVLGCAGLDFAGLAMGSYWLAVSAIGLMAGLITGMKYGYVDSMRIWRNSTAAETSQVAPTDTRVQVPTDAAAGSPAESVADKPTSSTR
jgi:hypothetical protein